MSRRQELLEQYKESKIEAGVYCITNTKNRKMFVGTTPNLRSLNGKIFGLNLGSDPNKALQKDWTAYGEEAFELQILEIAKQDDSGIRRSLKDVLAKLELKYLEQLQPYGESGYNSRKLPGST